VRSCRGGRPLRTFIATPQSATVITLDINHLDVNDARLDLKLRNRRVRVCPRFVRIAQNGQVAQPGLTGRGTAQHSGRGSAAMLLITG
jgi:hypothetical protein